MIKRDIDDLAKEAAKDFAQTQFLAPPKTAGGPNSKRKTLSRIGSS